MLLKLQFIMVCKDKGFQVFKGAEALLNKYVQPVMPIFKSISNSLKSQPFLINSLNLLTDIPLIGQKESAKHDLNKAQIRALARLEKLSGKSLIFLQPQ